MQTVLNRIALLSMVIMMAVTTGCEKEKTTETPFRIIQASEDLVIPDAVALPANLPGGNVRVATYYAVGVQKYKAQAKASAPGSFEWVFVAPDAKLYDGTNMEVGTHGAGPNWKLTGRIDSIYAQHFAPMKTAPSNNAGTIDWLLLMPKEGKTPSGIFSSVTYIQRIATNGGKAPTTPPTSVADIVDVPYTAVYRFSKKKP